MSKNKKIVISVSIVFVLLASVITGIILANIRRYSIKPMQEFKFNNHTEMIEISLDSKYNPMDGFNNNSVNKVRTIDNKYGLYSYFEGRMIVEPIYKDIVTLYNHKASGKSYFQLIAQNNNNIKIVDELGQNLSIFSYNETTNSTSTNIKLRDIDYNTKKNTVKAKVSNKFKNVAVEIKSANIVNTPYVDDEYCYELWDIVTKDNILYKNLYRVTDDEHELIQTINNETGIEIDQTNLEVKFLTNGQPVFVSHRDRTFNGSIIAVETQIFDINFNHLGTAKVSTELEQYKIAEFRVGNNIMTQYKIPANENKYDIYETDSLGKTNYFTLQTYKFSLKNGNYNSITFDYLINSYYDKFNPETVLINASKINDKKAETPANCLINERLQFKEIDYEFNYIKKINDDRYIASLNGSSNFNLIDENYNLIAHYEDADKIFATQNSIIAQNNGYYYVCNLDGVILKKYSNENIFFVNDDSYYIKKVEKEVNGKGVNEYYLEQLGLQSDTPLYTYSLDNKYIFQGQTYDLVKIVNPEKNPELTVLTTIKKENDNTYTYGVYTIEGNHLKTITGQTKDVFEPTKFYAEEDKIVIYLNDIYFVLDR